MDTDLAAALVDRFFGYLATTSQSDSRVAALPSTEGQRRMVETLAEELTRFGLDAVRLDAHGILTALMPGNVSGAPCIGFITHVDTVDVGLAADIHPQRLGFHGGDLCLNRQGDIWLRVAEHPEILPYLGEDILFSDGTSVLGADNKAAVTVVMAVLQRLREGDIPHGDIAVAFVPDEETGLRGAKILPLDRFPAAFAFTIDACERGEVTTETFNAAQAEIHILGVPAHPMSAKGVMVNPARVAFDLMAMFDPLQTPEHTEGREGYWWFNDVTANATEARLRVSIRDFDGPNFLARKHFVEEAVQRVQVMHERARIACSVTDTYANIGAALLRDARPLQLIKAAFAAVGVQPKPLAMRGGTDGSALSARGLPTANYFTGALNFHSRFEFLPVSAFVDAYRVTEQICRLASGSLSSDEERQSLPG